MTQWTYTDLDFVAESNRIEGIHRKPTVAEVAEHVRFTSLPSVKVTDLVDGLFPLAHGIPGRVGKLRAAGNAIVPQVAATFVRAFMEAQHK